jgi:hypothetical protein
MASGVKEPKETSAKMVAIVRTIFRIPLSRAAKIITMLEMQTVDDQ